MQRHTAGAGERGMNCEISYHVQNRELFGVGGDGEVGRRLKREGIYVCVSAC